MIATNVHLKAGSETQPVGKLCRYSRAPLGEWVFLGWINRGYKHRNSNAWGLNRRLLEWLHRQGIEQVFLYNRSEDETYWTFTGLMLKYGRLGMPDTWGGNLNLDSDEWYVIGRKIATEPNWVPEKNVTYVKCLAAEAA